MGLKYDRIIKEIASGKALFTICAVDQIHWEVKDMAVRSVSAISLLGRIHGYHGCLGALQVNHHKLGS